MLERASLYDDPGCLETGDGEADEDEDTMKRHIYNCPTCRRYFRRHIDKRDNSIIVQYITSNQLFNNVERRVCDPCMLHRQQCMPGGYHEHGESRAQ